MRKPFYRNRFAERLDIQKREDIHLQLWRWYQVRVPELVPKAIHRYYVVLWIWVIFRGAPFDRDGGFGEEFCVIRSSCRRGGFQTVLSSVDNG